jgi:hypothetical protein
VIFHHDSWANRSAPVLKTGRKPGISPREGGRRPPVRYGLVAVRLLGPGRGSNSVCVPVRPGDLRRGSVPVRRANLRRGSVPVGLAGPKRSTTSLRLAGPGRGSSFIRPGGPSRGDIPVGPTARRRSSVSVRPDGRGWLSGLEPGPGRSSGDAGCGLRRGLGLPRGAGRLVVHKARPRGGLDRRFGWLSHRGRRRRRAPELRFGGPPGPG